MKFVLQVINEQLKNVHLILRLAIYDIKGQYQLHYLGWLWQFLNPVLQIALYWFVFGFGIRRGSPVGDTPFLVWLLVGLIPWFFIGPAILQGSNSIYSRVSLVSKMKFPVSILPTTSIVTNSFNFLSMMLILVVLLVINKINAGLYLLQLPYYLFCLYVFLFSVCLLFSTISIIVRDFQLLIQSGMRMVFFLLPIVWKIDNLPPLFVNILKLNPIFYLIEGFRHTILGGGWFFSELTYTAYFWSLTLFILFLGSFMHIKFRKKFVDYI
ncbi:ABC transporter permease [Neobacillus kokaensis]|uniref:Transport permease protein n=1 Tax=Neobacillus kokaensis TaxID=2759023 RepID=A0ABQ3MXQ9_9BACI|nr:ABC transporter permease [Neobacillus kokaensis]GHH97445.1 teichoic acid translocation permease protein TagG [Neobacillus kokaensis]